MLSQHQISDCIIAIDGMSPRRTFIEYYPLIRGKHHIDLTGEFTAEQLEAIVKMMREAQQT
jgi:hypothetical protein